MEEGGVKEALAGGELVVEGVDEGEEEVGGEASDDVDGLAATESVVFTLISLCPTGTSSPSC